MQNKQGFLQPEGSEKTKGKFQVRLDPGAHLV